mmetsp:Transcript_30442/g.72393  ORF Transcript_30442/g.72393 Transcript_30442/m.72393 type:complete len:215 (-) Transcript_30442:155-799(-)
MYVRVSLIFSMDALFSSIFANDSSFFSSYTVVPATSLSSINRSLSLMVHKALTFPCCTIKYGLLLLNPAPSRRLMISFLVARLRCKKNSSFLWPMVLRSTTSSEFSSENRLSLLSKTISTKAFTAADPDPSCSNDCRSSVLKLQNFGQPSTNCTASKRLLFPDPLRPTTQFISGEKGWISGCCLNDRKLDSVIDFICILDVAVVNYLWIQSGGQ